jgi:large subunit ribosomal protein L4
MKRVALFSALTSKLKDGEIKVVTGLEKIEPKTKKMVDVIDKLELNGKNAQVLLIMPSGNENVNIVKAGRNIKGVTVTSANLINTYEILSNKRVLFMKSSIDSLKETFLK